MRSNWPLRLPAFVINGLSVATGIGLIQVLLRASLGAHAAQLATSGALCASLADLPNSVDRTWRAVLAAALACSLAALIIGLFRGSELALGVAIGVVAFAAMMSMAWGARAGPVSFAALLSVVFALAVPASQPFTLQLFGLVVLGAFAYFSWGVLSTALLQRRYRTLALASALQATARLLQLRADARAAPPGAGRVSALQKLIGHEAALAERLQVARNLLFTAPESERSRRDTAILLRVIDLRDVLLASRLDLNLLGDDAPAGELHRAVAARLLQIAATLESVEHELRAGRGTPFVEEIAPGRAGWESLPLPADDPRRRLLPALAGRLQRLADDVMQIQALLHGAPPRQPLSRSELQLFVESRLWPLAALRPHLTLRSPVMRHALRTALALSSAYFIEYALPWVSHPHWLVLSVAVVLRGNLEQTLSRRNARVFGTALGCLIVLLLARIDYLPLLSLSFLLAIATAHAFVNVRYLITAAAATLMALLQTHFVDPAAGFPVVERLIDTLLGAMIAWGFSYVLPSWERRSLPGAVDRALAALQNYAHQALTGEARDNVAQLIARRRAYDALDVMAAALQRGAVEPDRVRVPTRELFTLIENANQLMAHLSSIRLLLSRRAAELDLPQVTAALLNTEAQLQQALTRGAHVAPVEDGTTALQLLPAQSPAENPLPWLLRRLQLAAQDGARVAQAADRLQRALAARQGAAPGEGD